MYQPEQVRRDQENEGKRRIQSETLGVKRPSPTAKKPFVAKGHDAILQSLQFSGERILVTLVGDGSEVEGKLIARDKFTITVLTDDGRRRTLYKHAIEGFEPAQKQQVQ